MRSFVNERYRLCQYNQMIEANVDLRGIYLKVVIKVIYNIPSIAEHVYFITRIILLFQEM